MWDPVFDFAIPTAAALWNTKKLEANKYKAALQKKLDATRKSQGIFKDSLSWIWRKLGKPAIKKCANPAIGDALCAKVYIDSKTETEQRSATKLRNQSFTVYDVLDPILTIDEPVIEIEAMDIGGTLKRRVEDQLFASVNAMDPCDRPVSLSHDLPDLIPLGETTVTWTARDRGPNTSGGFNEDVKTQRVIVADTQAPIMIPPPSRVIEVDPNGSNSTGLPLANVNLGSPRVVDLADPEPTVQSTAPEFFPIDSRNAYRLDGDGFPVATRQRMIS